MFKSFFTELIYYLTIFITLVVGVYVQKQIPYAVTVYMNNTGFHLPENYTESMIEKGYF